MNAGFRQRGEEGLVEQGVLVGDHLLNAFMDGEEGVARAEAVRSVGVASVFEELFQGGDADFKEFVEVRADDGEEFEAFERGLGGILSFLEDSLVELQPAEFPVDVGRWRKRHINKLT